VNFTPRTFIMSGKFYSLFYPSLYSLIPSFLIPIQLMGEKVYRYRLSINRPSVVRRRPSVRRPSFVCVGLKFNATWRNNISLRPFIFERKRLRNPDTIGT